MTSHKGMAKKIKNKANSQGRTRLERVLKKFDKSRGVFTSFMDLPLKLTKGIRLAGFV